VKILFAIQATGNGHLSRAREVIPYLEKHGELDIMVSGSDAEVSVPYPVKYSKHGLGFTFGSKGGVNYWSTLKKLKPIRLLRDIRSFPIEKYDVVINDYEAITAWACQMKDKPCIALSHQSSFSSALMPRPAKRDMAVELLLKYYAPFTGAVALHFSNYDNFIHTPIIRSEIRQLESMDRGHCTVYLPAYHDKLLLPILKQVRDVEWHVFTKHSKHPYTSGNVKVKPINNQDYLQSLATCAGLVSGGGFEGPAEAMFLGKKLFVIPQKGQYEQQCNAQAMRLMGAPVVHQLTSDFVDTLKNWLHRSKRIEVNYPDQTEMLVAKAVQMALDGANTNNSNMGSRPASLGI